LNFRDSSRLTVAREFCRDFRIAADAQLPWRRPCMRTSIHSTANLRSALRIGVLTFGVAVIVMPTVASLTPAFAQLGGGGGGGGAGGGGLGGLGGGLGAAAGGAVAADLAAAEAPEGASVVPGLAHPDLAVAVALAPD
jgi:hypothetical protein